MTATTRRSSARLASGSSPESSPSHKEAEQRQKQSKDHDEGEDVSAGKKRKADVESLSEPKKERKTQTKLEEYSTEQASNPGPERNAQKNGEEEVEDGISDEEMRDAGTENESKNKDDSGEEGEEGEEADAKADAKQNGHAKEDENDNAKDASNVSKAERDAQAKEKNDPGVATTSNGQGEQNGAVEISDERKDAMPSNILEKGIIYFFVRGRVGVEDPQGVKDIARSYIVLRPLPQGTKLGDGPIPDLENNRLCALPKKVLPQGSKDVFMSFVEKSHITIEQLKRDFMEGSTYSTKTTGVRHTPNVTPVGEGVYAITSTGRSSHLAYMLTIPSELGPVQTELGLMEKGSFVVSVKNPESSSSANASLPEPAHFSQKLMDEFYGRAWAPLQPPHLDYANCQFLLIGDGHGDLGKAVEPMEKDEKNDDKETPQEELEKLQGEDEERVQGLKEDDAVFEDLGVSKKDYPKIPTTW